NILLDVGQTTMIDKIARIDVKHIINNARASLSLMTTSHLPINVIQTKDVEQFDEKALKNNQLGLRGPTVEILAIGEEEATEDIVLSSAGGTSIQCNRDQYVIFAAKDIILSSVEQTPFFNKHAYTDDQQETDDDNQYQSNELEMIINEKLWKRELK
ncbi:unnamed protein product, partial [Didymodactylos carnosus]